MIEQLMRTLLGLLCMAVVAMGISRWILPRFMGSLEESMELYLLCAICVMMFMLKVCRPSRPLLLQGVHAPTAVSLPPCLLV